MEISTLKKILSIIPTKKLVPCKNAITKQNLRGTCELGRFRCLRKWFYEYLSIKNLSPNLSSQ